MACQRGGPWGNQVSRHRRSGSLYEVLEKTRFGVRLIGGLCSKKVANRIVAEDSLNRFTRKVR